MEIANSFPADSIENHFRDVVAFGYVLLRNIYNEKDIENIAEHFDNAFLLKLNSHRVQSRDYRRFACKLSICKEYEAILNNPYIHRLMTRILGEGYVLFNINSHSSLPGCSRQAMHVDSTDPINSNTFANSNANVVFLHIPLTNTKVEHGATEVWPITYIKKMRNHLDSYKWVRDNLETSPVELSRGDVILRLDNCLHAGGMNKSSTRRHFITLIFAREYFYLNHNSGMIPGGQYDGPEMARLPYRIASNCTIIPPNSTDTFINRSFGKPLHSIADAAQKIIHRQYECIDEGLPESVFDQIKSAPEMFIQDASAVFNLIGHLVPLVKAGFGDSKFKFHSICLNKTTREIDCDDPVFKRYRAIETFNNDNNLIRVHLPLARVNHWLNIYPGNKTLSINVLKNCDSYEKYKIGISSNERAILITTGALPYSIEEGVPTIELTFVRSSYIPSYDDRYWVSDIFALSLPNNLGKLLRYGNIFITNDRYKDFQFDPVVYFYTIISNYVEVLRMDKKLIGNILLVVSGICLLPAILYIVRKKHVRSLLAYA